MDKAIVWLDDRLPRDWGVESPAIENREPGAPLNGARMTLRGPNGTGTALAVEERQSLTPRDVFDLHAKVLAARNMGAHLPLVVIAPWLSKRTQELLAEHGLGYIDLTGNALVRVDSPPFYLQTMGADRNPAPRERGQAQLRGPKAARLIRLLVDVRPPYDLGELAEASGLTPGYVSRLLDTLNREALIERTPRGPVEAVDIAALILRWSSSYDVFRSNQTFSLIAPSGPRSLLGEIAGRDPSQPRAVVSGSFAAATIKAPVAAPTLLLAYCERPRDLATEHQLLPSDEGANVVLLSPFDPVVWERVEIRDGLTYAAPAQVAVDCLTGNGRMPAEGESLLSWMVEHEASWRAESLRALA